MTMTEDGAKDALAALATLLAPKSTKVAAAVRLALEEPERYATKFAAALEDRNVEDGPVDPWLALTIALDRANLLGSLDWKFAAEDIKESCRGDQSASQAPQRPEALRP